MRALVTGGAGFIGSAVVARLMSGGNHVRVLDDLSSGSPENLRRLEGSSSGGLLEFVEGTIEDLEAVRAAVGGMDLVIHLAALVSVPASLQTPQRCYTVNLNGSLNVLSAASEAGVKRVVLASSAAVYGDASGRAAESDPPSPLSPYAASKLTMEAAAALHTDRTGLETVCLRYFNVYGPNQRPDSQYAAVIPAFVAAAIENRPMQIHGDGSQRRDLIHVSDVARATLAAASAPLAGAAVINIGCGESVTIAELAEILHGLVPGTPAPVQVEPRPGDIDHSEADIERARRELGFDTHLPLTEGLRGTLEWSRQVRREAVQG